MSGEQPGPPQMNSTETAVGTADGKLHEFHPEEGTRVFIDNFTAKKASLEEQLATIIADESSGVLNSQYGVVERRLKADDIRKDIGELNDVWTQLGGSRIDEIKKQMAETPFNERDPMLGRYLLEAEQAFYNNFAAMDKAESAQPAAETPKEGQGGIEVDQGRKLETSEQLSDKAKLALDLLGIENGDVPPMVTLMEDWAKQRDVYDHIEKKYEGLLGDLKVAVDQGNAADQNHLREMIQAFEANEDFQKYAALTEMWRSVGGAHIDRLQYQLEDPELNPDERAAIEEELDKAKHDFHDKFEARYGRPQAEPKQSKDKEQTEPEQVGSPAAERQAVVGAPEEESQGFNEETVREGLPRLYQKRFDDTKIKTTFFNSEDFVNLPETVRGRYIRQNPDYFDSDGKPLSLEGAWLSRLDSMRGENSTDHDERTDGTDRVVSKLAPADAEVLRRGGFDPETGRFTRGEVSDPLDQERSVLQAAFDRLTPDEQAALEQLFSLARVGAEAKESQGSRVKQLPEETYKQPGWFGRFTDRLSQVFSRGRRERGIEDDGERNETSSTERKRRFGIKALAAAGVISVLGAFVTPASMLETADAAPSTLPKQAQVVPVETKTGITDRGKEATVDRMEAEAQAYAERVFSREEAKDIINRFAGERHNSASLAAGFNGDVRTEQGMTHFREYIRAHVVDNDQIAAQFYWAMHNDGDMQNIAGMNGVLDSMRNNPEFHDQVVKEGNDFFVHAEVNGINRIGENGTRYASSYNRNGRIGVAMSGYNATGVEFRAGTVIVRVSDGCVQLYGVEEAIELANRESPQQPRTYRHVVNNVGVTIATIRVDQKGHVQATPTHSAPTGTDVVPVEGAPGTQEGTTGGSTPGDTPGVTPGDTPGDTPHTPGTSSDSSEKSKDTDPSAYQHVEEAPTAVVNEPTRPAAQTEHTGASSATETQVDEIKGVQSTEPPVTTPTQSELDNHRDMKDNPAEGATSPVAPGGAVGGSNV